MPRRTNFTTDNLRTSYAAVSLPNQCDVFPAMGRWCVEFGTLVASPPTKPDTVSGLLSAANGYDSFLFL